MKIEINSWHEAEMDEASAKAVIIALSELLYDEGLIHHHDTAYAAVRLLESHEAWIEGGRVRGEEDSDDD